MDDANQIFDLDVKFSGPERPLDSQAGLNVHMAALLSARINFGLPFLTATWQHVPTDTDN
ncbi:MAG: hypothetical protein WB586_02050 [Chthoniobacterales bacterium]